MQEEIKTLQKSLGISVLFVTHDQDEAMAMSDRIVVMRDGKMVQSGPPEDVYNHPLTDWVASFLGDTNLIPCTVVERNGKEAVVDLGGWGCGRSGTAGRRGEIRRLHPPEHLKFGSAPWQATAAPRSWCRPRTWAPRCATGSPPAATTSSCVS